MDEEVASSSGRRTRAKRVNYKLLSQSKLREYHNPPAKPRKNNLGNLLPVADIKEEIRYDDNDLDTRKSVEEKEQQNEVMTRDHDNDSNNTTEVAKEGSEQQNEVVSDHSDIELEPPRLHMMMSTSDMDEVPHGDHNFALNGKQGKEEVLDMEGEPQRGHKRARVAKVKEMENMEEVGEYEEPEEQEVEQEEDREEEQGIAEGPGTCVNCNAEFKLKKAGKASSQQSTSNYNTGYNKYSLNTALPNSSNRISGREELEVLTGKILPHGLFLCPKCWSLLNMISRYRDACTKLFKRTAKTSYLAKQRLRNQVPHN